MDTEPGPGEDDFPATLGGGDALAAAEGPPRLAGDTIGSLIVLRQLGEGGMGTVLAAYDPELDRQVAVKLLRRGEVPDSQKAQLRMRREAQAMARLTHPNVLPVYEVGSHDGELYLVMELVDGPSLDGWLEAEPRTLDAILEMLRGAARGLAAAHEAGLVHRDFKPENVLVGSDGRPRVADFGIAGVAGGPAQAGERLAVDDWLAAIRESALDSALTRPGAVLGTPAYMAPEQLAGERVDGRADQFAFCVVAWEAIYGERPFGNSMQAYVAGLIGGKPLAPPPDGVAPRWVAEALMRGLSLEPDARFASMEELLEALEPAPPSAARRWLPWGVAAVVALAAAAGVFALRAPAEDPCPPPPLDGVWGAPERAALEARFRASGLPFAEGTFHTTAGILDRYAEELTRAHVEACRDSAVRHAQSDEMLDLRMACVETRRRELDALVDALGEVEAGSLSRVVGEAERLPQLAACEDPDALGRVPLPEDPAVRRRVAEARGQLAELRAAAVTGRATEGLRRIEGALPGVEELGYPPLHAEALRVYASLLHRAGRTDEAIEVLDRTISAAARAGHERLVFDAANHRAMLFAVGRRRAPEVLAQAGLLEALAAQSGDPRADSDLHQALAIARYSVGDIEGAIDEQRQVVALRREAGESPQRIAFARANLGAFLKDAGRLAEAEDELRACEAEIDAAAHPGYTAARKALGVTLLIQGRAGEALAVLRAAHEADAAWRPPGHPALLEARTFVALALLELRLVDQAREALDVVGATAMTPNIDRGWALRTYGQILTAAGEPEAAERAFAEAIDTFTELVGPTDRETGKTWRERAESRLAAGDVAGAREAAARAWASLESSRVRPDWVVEALLTRAAIERADGRDEAALAILDEAAALATRELGPALPVAIEVEVARRELRPESGGRSPEALLAASPTYAAGLRARVLRLQAAELAAQGLEAEARAASRAAREALGRGHALDRSRAGAG